MNKAIYEFDHPDGTKRFADPLAVQWRLECLLGDFGKVYADFHGLEPTAALLAADKIGRAICEVFELPPPISGIVFKEKPTGTPMSVWRDQLYDYMEWLEKNVETDASLPICSTPSEASSFAENLSPISNMSNCG